MIFVSSVRKLQLALIVLIAAMSAPTTAMHQDNNRVEFIRGYLAAWNAHAPDAVVAAFSNDAIYYNSSIDEKRDAKDTVYNMMIALLSIAPDIRWKMTGQPVATQNSVAFEWVMEGFSAECECPDKERIIKGASFVTFSNNRIVYFADYFNDAQFEHTITY